MQITKLAFDFRDANLIDASNQAEAAGADVFIWNDQMYPVPLRNVTRSIEAAESAVIETLDSRPTVM